MERRDRLNDWLALHNARKLWGPLKPCRGAGSVRVECYQIGNGTVIISLYQDGGWDLHTPLCTSNAIDATLMDASDRLGVPFGTRGGTDGR